MRNGKSNRANNKVRAPRPQRVPERITDGVYSNNYFMHAATSHIGTLVKVETVQGAIYEGIFKTFSHDFDVVLELAHKVDNADPQKLNAQEVVECLIFHSKDIVYMCAQNIEPNYALKGAFQIDSNISKYNGEVAGEKKLQPWEGPPVCNGEECDLEASDNNRNGWDVHEMFLRNEQFGVQTSYDDSLADYTCQIHRKDTKDFREEEAKAARVAMEIERNPSSQARASLENGENEEELFAAVSRTGNEGDEKYVPPPMKRKSLQHHRVSGGGSRGQYPTNARQGPDSLSPHNAYPPRDREPRINGQIMENHAKRHNRPPPLILRETARGNQRSYNVPESPGRQQMNNSASLSRYHHQGSQQYHQQQQSQPQHGNHASQAIRDNTNRSSPENKNASLIASNVTQQSQNIPPYSTNMNQRTFSQSVVPIPNHTHSQNVPVQQQSKSQRTSPVSMSSLPNGSAEYQSKPLPPVSQPPPHQYHNQNPQNHISNVGNQQRKHHHHQQHHHSNTKVREDQINELKKFGSDFNLSYEMKTKESDAPKPIQVVSNRNKSPPVSQAPTERNVVPVSIVATLPPNKYTTVAVTSHQSMGQPVTTQPPHSQTPAAGPQTPTGVAVTLPTSVAIAAAAVIKTHPHVLPQPATFQQAHQHMHLQQRETQVLMQHPAHLPQPPHLSHHTQSLPPKTQPQKNAHTVPLHQNTAPPPPVLAQVPTQPPTSAQLPQQHSTVTTQQSKTVINSQVQNVQNVHTVVPPQNASQPIQQQAVSSQHQTCALPPNVHQRPPLQQQPSQKGNNQSSASQSPTPTDANTATEADTVANSKEEEDEVLDEVASTLKKSTLNPNAKEFIYNPAAKPFTPASRSPSTPTQSRPHTPQTPSNYSIHPGNAPVATGIQMVMPTYVVAATPGYVQPPPAASRIRKVPVNSHRTPEFHPSNIPVSAVTGQPLLAPSVTLAPSPLGHGTSFPVPAYPHHPQLTAHQYPHMIRMVQQGGMVPLVPSTISYHDTAGSNAAAAVYVNHGSGAAMAMAPHTPHVHHTQQHPPPSTAPSPSQTPQGPSQSHTPNSYQHPSLGTQSAPPYQPIVCPVIQAPPTHAPPHHIVAQSQQHTMQQYLQHQQVQPSHIQVSLLPHSS